MNREVVVRVAGADLKVTVASRASTVEAYLREARTSAGTKMVVGLDVEWNSSDSNNKVALLKLCNGVETLLVQLLQLDYIPNALKEFLADPAVIFVGVGITRDVQNIGHYGLWYENALELGHLAAKALKNPNLEGLGLVDLTRHVLGLEVEKMLYFARSGWDATFLSDEHIEQIEYAATDAYLGYLLGVNLLGGN